MTPINFEVRDAAQWAANQYLNRQELTPERRGEVKDLTEYNILAYADNASSALLAIAAVAAAFFSYAAAVVFGAVSLFVHFIVSKELENYAKPEGVAALVHVANQTAPTAQDRIRNICQKLGIQPLGEDWTENIVSIFGHAVWKRTIPQDAPALVDPEGQGQAVRGL